MPLSVSVPVYKMLGLMLPLRFTTCPAVPSPKLAPAPAIPPPDAEKLSPVNKNEAVDSSHQIDAEPLVSRMGSADAIVTPIRNESAKKAHKTVRRFSTAASDRADMPRPCHGH